VKLGVRVAFEGLGKIQPLVVSVVPVKGESLSGLVARSTRSNVLRHPRIILAEVGIEVTGAGSVGLDIEGLESRLAEKIGCTVADVRARSTPFVSGSSKTEVYLGGSRVSRPDLRLRHRWISPATLAHTDAHLSFWESRLLPYCPHSLERLISTCSQCNERLRWISAWGIGTCENCRQPVTHPDGETLKPHLAKGYRTFARLMSSDPEDRAVARAGLAPEIAALSALTLPRLILGIGRSCRSDPIPGQHLALMTPQQIAEAASLGTELIHDFPRRFRDAVVEQIDRIGWGSELALRPLLKALRSLASTNSVRPEQTALVRAAIPEVFEAKSRALGGFKAPVMLFRDFARLSGLTSKEMKSIVDHKALKFSMTGGGPRPRIQYDRASTMEFIERLNASVRPTIVESLIGVPRYGVEQLVCLGELLHEDHPAVALVYDGLRISGVSTFQSEIAEACQKTSPPEGAVPLARAIQRFGGRVKPWGAILRSMRLGSVRYWMAPPGSRARPIPFSRLALVLPQDLETFENVRFNETSYVDFRFFEADVTQMDACEILNVGPKQIARISTAGGLLFRDTPKSLRISKNAVLDLAMRMITPAEICVRWTVHPSKVNRLMANHRDVARVYTGWNRDDVERVLSCVLQPKLLTT